MGTVLGPVKDTMNSNNNIVSTKEEQYIVRD